ncbi:MAG: hypothetical protein WDM77_07525 [Steroidobacteraceae bacterium]
MGFRYDYDTLEAKFAWHDQVFLTAAWTPDALRYAYHRVLRDRSAPSYGLQLRQAAERGIFPLRRGGLR